MWILNQIDNQKYSCFHYGIALIAGFYQKNYQMIFLDLWGFDYSYDSTKKIGERLGAYEGDVNCQRELLKKYHGLDFFNIEVDFHEIKILLEKQPLLLHVDAFNCEWLPYYNKHHIQHTIIIYDVIGESLFFCDQYVKMEDRRYLSKNFVQKISKIATVVKNMEDYKDINGGDYYDEIINTGIRYIERKSEDNLSSFKLDITNNLQLAQEIDKNDVVASFLLRQLKFVSDNRYSIKDSFVYLEKELQMDFKDIITRLEVLSDKYDELRYILMKSIHIKQEVDSSKVETIISDILLRENELNNFFLGLKK